MVFLDSIGLSRRLTALLYRGKVQIPGVFYEPGPWDESPRVQYEMNHHGLEDQWQQHDDLVEDATIISKKKLSCYAIHIYYQH